jgi:hypothetical protein
MRFKARYTRVSYPHGATRLKRVFAFLPTYIDGTIVWLETYEVLQFFHITPHQVKIEDENVVFTNGNWIDISTRLINPKSAAK